MMLKYHNDMLVKLCNCYSSKNICNTHLWHGCAETEFPPDPQNIFSKLNKIIWPNLTFMYIFEYTTLDFEMQTLCKYKLFRLSLHFHHNRVSGVWVEPDDSGSIDNPKNRRNDSEAFWSRKISPDSWIYLPNQPFATAAFSSWQPYCFRTLGINY